MPGQHHHGRLRGLFRWENLSLAGTGEYVIDVSFGLRYYHFFRKDDGVITEESMDRDYKEIRRRVHRLDTGGGTSSDPTAGPLHPAGH